MELAGELAVGLLDLVRARAALDAERRVVVLVFHRRRFLGWSRGYHSSGRRRLRPRYGAKREGHCLNEDADGAGLLRFVACGSVDDGKSTLIGRLLFESGSLADDQLAALERDSRSAGRAAGDPDWSLLLDGLDAEREQGITIDVAWRYFATARRKFIVADAPGHEQYTRNMVTGASSAHLALILVDARRGIVTQTRRHGYLARLLGIRHAVLAVNKMDAVGFDADVFTRLDARFAELAADLGFVQVAAIPVSAQQGDGVAAPSARMPWYRGPTLLAYLEQVEIDSDAKAQPMRLPVQLISRPHQDFRGYAGTIASGTLLRGAPVKVMPAGRTSSIARIVTADGDLEHAAAGSAVTVTLADAIDVARGDMICAAEAPLEVASRFAATLIWLHEQPMSAQRSYAMKIATRAATANIALLRERIDIETLRPVPARELALNEIGRCEILVDAPLPYETYATNRVLGGFILIDRHSNATVAAGLIDAGLPEPSNNPWQSLDVDKAARAAAKGQRPCVLWFTGISGAGKSTIANMVERRLHAMGRHTHVLDGDNLRHGLNRDLGFTDADRVENVRRVAEVAKLMVEAGLIVIVALIAPFRSERRMARALFERGEFIEIHVDTALAVAEARDRKGLYRRARRGEIANFTGIDSPYEVPEAPEIRIDTATVSATQAAQRIIEHLAAASPRAAADLDTDEP
jgi:bifunctional enzyme CysN/CysC